MKPTLTIAAATASLLALSLTARAAITGVTIDSVSSEWRNGPDMHALNMVNLSGLSGGGQTIDLADQWETQPYQSSAWVIFDLNTTADISSFHIWNFNYPNYTGRGVHTLSISTAGPDRTWTDPVPYTFNAATGAAGDPGQDFSLASPWANTRYVKFDNMVYYGGGDSAGHIGMAEVQFTAATPEPASLAFLALAAPMFLRRRSVRHNH